MMKKKCLTGLCCFAVIFLAAFSTHAQLIDNGNGTISDNVTGLMWQKATAPGTYTWAQALSYCENLVYPSNNGYSDWRLPTIKELDSIVDLSRYNPAINTDYFPDTLASFYWSSTTYAGYTHCAWDMYFYYGYDGYLGNKDGHFYVLAVRGGQSGAFGPLVIAQTPMSGPPGTTFTQWGTGFSPNSTATLHFRKPDGTEYPTQQQAIDASGHFEITYTAPYDKPVGNYTWWAIDGPSGQSSNAVTYAIEGVAGQLHHFEFSAIGNQTVNTWFTVTIEAVDYNGDRVTSFEGEVSLSHNGPGQLSFSSQILLNGRVNFPLKVSQPNANCVLSCHGSGVNGYSNIFAVTGGSATSGTISGFVTGSNKTIEVIMSRTPYGLEVARVTALADGQYLFAGVSAGLYYIWAVDSDENSSVTQSVKLEAGQPARVPDLKIHSKRRPVIFVPGIMGSDKKWNPGIYPKLPQKQPADQDDLQLHDPGGFVHQNPLAVGWTNLEWMLEGDYAVFKCPYDWRVNLMSSKDTYKKYLMPIIEKAKEKTGWEKVDIVAHSMGGLLVRSYIQSDDYKGDIDKFAMVGTPNKGSLNVYPMWEGGDAMLADENAGSPIYLYSNVADNLYNKIYRGKHLYTFYKVVDSGIDTFIPKKMNISNQKARSFFWDYCQSAWNLMPTFDDCLKKDGDFKNIEKLRNKWLIGLNNDSGVSLMKIGGPVQTRIFASKSEDTLSWLNVKESTMNGLYEDGIEEKSPHKEENGDGTVPYESAQLDGVSIMAGSYGAHGNLIKSFALDIEYFLNDGRTFAASKMVPMAVETEPEYTSSLGVSVTGPPSVLLTDPAGLKCGIDQTTGEVFEEIAGSKTLGQSGDAMATIPDPVNGAFTVKLSGSETGTASISISYMTETDSEEQQFAVYFSGEPITFTFTLDSDGSPGIQVSDIPAAPIGLSGTAYPSGETQLTRLSWQASDDPSITGYRIYARNENDSDFTLLAEVPAGQTQYDTSDPWNDPARTYAVSAVDSEGHEGFLSDFAENTTHLLADFETGSVTGETPFEVQLTDTSTGTPTSWLWDFGDGDTSTEQNPTHTYNEPGSYTVTLTVTDAASNQDMESKTELMTVSQGDFVVTSVEDSLPGAALIPGTLRYAIQQATDNGDEQTDTIRFADGLSSMSIYLQSQLNLPGSIVIDGSNAPTLDGWFFQGRALLLQSASNVEISGLRFVHFPMAIFVLGGSNIKIADNTVRDGWIAVTGFFFMYPQLGAEINGNVFEGVESGGIDINAAFTGSVENILISDNTLLQNNYIAIRTSETDGQNSNCRINNVTVQNNHTQNEIYAYIGSGTNNTIEGLVVQDNILEYSAENTIGYGIGLINRADSATNSIDAVVRRNIVTGQKITGIGISGNVTADVSNNAVNGNSVGMTLWRGCTVKAANNLLAKNIHGIEIDRYTNTELINNIIVDNCLSGVTSFSGLPLTGPVLAYNNVWNNGTNYIGLSSGETDLSIDPKFIDSDTGNYHLAGDSPCIDAGNPDIAYNDGAAGQGAARSDIGLYGGPGSTECVEVVPSVDYIKAGVSDFYLVSMKISEKIKQVFNNEFDPDTQYRIRADVGSYSCETSAKAVSPSGTQILLTDDGSNGGDRYPFDLIYGGSVLYPGTPELGDWHFEVTSGGQPYTGTVTLGENTLEAPEILQPVNGAVNTGTTPAITWQMPENSAAPEGFELYIFKGKPEAFNSKYAIFYTYIDNPAADRFQVPAGVLEPGTVYYVVVSAQIEENSVYYLAGEIARFNPTAIAGDLNTDGFVDLADAVIALKIVAGMETTDGYAAADANGDSRIGIEEVVYILQKAAGLR